MNEKNIDRFQALRGICILAVILIHCQSYNSFDSSASSFLYFFGRNAISFPVSIFMFIAGYFVNPDRFLSGGGGTAWKWIRHRAKRLLLPYLFWTMVYMTIYAVFLNKELSLKYIVSCLLLGKTATPFYYIIVLTYFTFLTPWLASIVSDKRFTIAIVSVAVGFMVCGYVCQFLGIQAFSLMKYSPIWIGFYYFGMRCRKLSILDRIKGKNFCVILVITYIIELLETLILIRLNMESIAYSQMRITSFLYAMAFLMWFLQKRIGDILCNALAFVGDNSYGVFFIHYLIILIIRPLINNKLLYPVGMTAEFISALFFSLLIIKVVKLTDSKTLHIMTGI